VEFNRPDFEPFQINMFAEKIFVFLWLWFFTFLVMAVLNLVFWLWRTLLMRSKVYLVMDALRVSSLLNG
jgi:hypothetical protein